MGRLKAVILWMIVGFLLFIASIWTYYAIFQVFFRFEPLLLCSEGRDDLIPKSLCQAYLFNFGGRSDDVAKLNQEGIGVGWVMYAEDEDDRKKLVDFLVKKGVDINAMHHRAGITALHNAVLENNLANVELLLSFHANPCLRDRNHGKTPLEFALELKGKPNQPDRTAIIKLLENKAHASMESPSP